MRPRIEQVPFRRLHNHRTPGSAKQHTLFLPAVQAYRKPMKADSIRDVVEFGQGSQVLAAVRKRLECRYPR